MAAAVLLVLASCASSAPTGQAPERAAGQSSLPPATVEPQPAATTPPAPEAETPSATPTPLPAPTATPVPATGIDLIDGFRATELLDGLRGPTQIAPVADGRFVIAELNGGENDGEGRVLLVDLDNPAVEPVVLQKGLLKPTGVAVVDDVLWIMEKQTLSTASLEPGTARTVVLDDLPFNGRSQGTLTPTGDGGLLYNTSGTRDGSRAAEGSGTLFRIAGAEAPSVIATGFKHAYAHTFDGQGRLWVTEMSDGRYDDERSMDEIVQVEPGIDAGWPMCVDDNRPVEQYGGTVELCATPPRSQALFSSGATPTSIAIAPWDAETLVVTLWQSGFVLTVPTTDNGGDPWRGEAFISGIEHPQHLVADGDRLLLVDYDGGRIVSVEPT